MSLRRVAARVYPYMLVAKLLLGVLQLLDFFMIRYHPMIESKVAGRVFQLGFSLVVPLVALVVLWVAASFLSGWWGQVFAVAPLFFCLHSVELGVSLASLLMCVVGVALMQDRGRFLDALCWILSFFLGLGVVHWGVLRPLGVWSPFGGLFSLMLNVHHVLRRLFPVLALPFLFFWVVKPLVGLRFRLPEVEVCEQGFDRFSWFLLGFSVYLSVYAAVYPYFSSVNLSGVEFGVDLPHYMQWLYVLEDVGGGLTSGVWAQRLFFFLFIYGFRWVTGLGTYTALQFMPVLLNPLFVLASCFFSWEVCRNGRVVAWCGLLSATSMTITVGLYAFFLNNLLALVIALFSLGLLFRAVRLGEVRLLMAASLGGGLLVYTHPWTMDQLLAGLVPVIGLILYRRGPRYVERVVYLGGYLVVVGVAEVVKILFLGGGGGLEMTSTALSGLVVLSEIWSSLFRSFPYIYSGFISNIVLLGLASAGLYVLRVDDVPMWWLCSLVMLSSVVYFVSFEINKSRILYNLPFGFLGALGLLWVFERRGLPSTVFVTAYSLFYLFVSIGSLVW